MRSFLITAAGVALLAFAASIDFLVNIPRFFDPTAFRISMTARIWLSSLLMVAYAAANFAYLTIALRKPALSKWASILILLVGTACILYLPMWTLGLPEVSRLLSTRWNPLTPIISRGGLISMLRLQLAIFIILGSAALWKRRKETASFSSTNAA
jgi:hypothetical protein